MTRIMEIFVGASIATIIFLAINGINVFPFILVVGLALLLWNMLRKNGVGLGDSSTDIEYTAKTELNFEMIGGQDAAIQELKEALEFILQQENIKSFGIRPLKGILLTGPPGTGKTLLAKAAAGFTDSVFLVTSGSEFIQKYAGVGAQRVRTMFKTARQKAQKLKKRSAIIFIDEIDILGGKRGSNLSHHEYDQTLNQLLVEMDGMKSDGSVQILVIGATNRAEALDDALMRPGRFDRQVKVDLPDKEGRIAILRIHTQNKPLEEDVNLSQIAHQTFGFSGAHLESLANEAAIFALREQSEKLSQRHLREAIDKVIMGEKSDRKPSPNDLKRVAVHEAGHALMGELLNPNSVSSVTIKPRGRALGYVRHNPDEEDTYLLSRRALENRIKVALAGSLAEELLLGDNSTGASGDFAQTMNMVRHMIASGMSSLGVVDIDQLPKDIMHQASSDILLNLESVTRELMLAHLDEFKLIISILEDKENISGEELRSCLNDLKAVG